MSADLNPKPPLWLRVINALSGLYALGVVIYLLLRLIVRDGWWWLAFLHNFTPYYFAPVLLLLPMALLLRQRVMFLRLLPLLVIGLILYGPYWLPRPQPVTADSSTFKMVTFNVLPDLRPMDAIADWLRTEDADLVLLQELPTAPATELRAALKDDYAFSDDNLLGTTQLSLSQHEILSAEEIDLGTWWIRRLVLNINDRELAVYNVHMPLPTRAAPASLEEYNANGMLPLLMQYDETRRNMLIRALLTRLQDETLPYIVAGDFNTSDNAVIYAEMTAVMGDSFREVAIGFGATFPADVGEEGIPDFIPPLLRIDYVWHSPQLVPVNAATGPHLGSDHLPLIVNLAWQVN